MHLQSMGERGELLDVEAAREQWSKDGMYCIAPHAVQYTLHLLAIGGQRNTRTLEDAQVCFAKIAEVLEAVWQHAGRLTLFPMAGRGFTCPKKCVSFRLLKFPWPTPKDRLVRQSARCIFGEARPISQRL